MKTASKYQTKYPFLLKYEDGYSVTLPFTNLKAAEKSALEAAEQLRFCKLISCTQVSKYPVFEH